jgi:hypothetical protein
MPRPSASDPALHHHILHHRGIQSDRSYYFPIVSMTSDYQPQSRYVLERNNGCTYSHAFKQSDILVEICITCYPIHKRIHSSRAAPVDAMYSAFSASTRSALPVQAATWPASLLLPPTPFSSSCSRLHQRTAHGHCAPRYLSDCNQHVVHTPHVTQPGISASCQKKGPL